MISPNSGGEGRGLLDFGWGTLKGGQVKGGKELRRMCNSAVLPFYMHCSYCCYFSCVRACVCGTACMHACMCKLWFVGNCQNKTKLRIVRILILFILVEAFRFEAFSLFVFAHTLTLYKYRNHRFHAHTPLLR